MNIEKSIEIYRKLGKTLKLFHNSTVGLRELGRCPYNQKVSSLNPRVNRVISPLRIQARPLTSSCFRDRLTLLTQKMSPWIKASAKYIKY